MELNIDKLIRLKLDALKKRNGNLDRQYPELDIKSWAQILCETLSIEENVFEFPNADTHELNTKIEPYGNIKSDKDKTVKNIGDVCFYLYLHIIQLLYAHRTDSLNAQSQLDVQLQ